MKRTFTFRSLAAFVLSAMAFIGSQPLVAAPQSPDGGKAGRKQIDVLPKRMTASSNSLEGVRSSRPVALSHRKTVGDNGGTLGGIDLRGCVVFSQAGGMESDIPGIFRFPSDASDDFSLIQGNIDCSAGFAVADDFFYAVNYTSFWGMIDKVFVETYDYYTWERISKEEVDQSFLSSCVATDPTTGIIYGSFYDEDTWQYEFGTVDYASKERTSIMPLEQKWSGCAFSADGSLYAVTENGDFYAVDKETGSSTLIGNAGVTNEYMGGAAIDPVSGRFFWTVCTSEDSALYEIDLATGVGSLVYTLAGHEQITSLYVAAPEAEDGAPAAVSNLVADFFEDSLSGKLIFDVPTTTFGGTAGTGEITYIINANDKQIATGKVAYGDKVSVDVTMPESALYKFEVVTSNAVGNSPKARIKKFIGTDSPIAPAVSMTASDGIFTLTWVAVTESANGGFIVPDEIVYNVTRYPGAVAVAKGIKETTFAEHLDMPESFTEFYYVVNAEFRGKVSEGATTPKVGMGPFEPPYEELFEDANSLDLFTVIDANGDNISWSYSGWRENNAALLMTPYAGFADDWLISPALRLKGGNRYKVSANVRCQLDGSTEVFEMRYGTSPTVEGMTKELLSPTEVYGRTEVNHGGYMEIEEDGIYYFGIHGMSDSEKGMKFVVLDVKVEAGLSNGMPGMSTDIKAVPDIDGGLQAEITFTTPSVTVGGGELSEIKAAYIYRNDKLVKTYEEPGTGVEITYVDEPYAEGMQHYSIVCENGEGMGMPAEFDCYIGFATPEAPRNVRIEENEVYGNVTVSWEAPGVDIYGNPLLDEYVSYCISSNSGTLMFSAEEIGDNMSFTWQAIPEDSQSFVQFAVWSVTEGGENVALTAMIPIGTPDETPYEESFGGGNLSHIMAVVKSFNKGSWSIITDEDDNVKSSDDDGGLLCMYSKNIDGGSSIMTGKIDLSDLERPSLSFKLYKDDSDSNDNQIDVIVGVGEEFYTIHSVSINDLKKNGWNEITVSLQQFADEDISIQLVGTRKSVDCASIYVDELRVVNGDPVNVDSHMAEHACVRTADGQVIINGADGSLFRVVATDGRIISLGTLSGETGISVAPGVYVVTVGRERFKIIVKK